MLLTFCHGEQPLAQYSYTVIYSNPKSINLAMPGWGKGPELCEGWGQRTALPPPPFLGASSRCWVSMEEAERDASCPVDAEVSFNTKDEFVVCWPVGEDMCVISPLF